MIFVSDDENNGLGNLSTREPSRSLPSVGGEQYLDEKIRIDYHAEGAHEHYFISSKEVIGFPVLTYPAKICRAFNSDVLTQELWMPDSMGCVEQNSEIYARDCEQDSTARLLVIYYDPVLRSELEEHISIRNPLFLTGHNFTLSPTLKQLRQSIIRFMLGEYSWGKLIAESITTLVIVETLKSFDKRLKNSNELTPKLNKQALERVLAFIEENIDQDIGLEEMGEIVCLSKYHFLRCFKHTIGLTPYAYLTQRRIEKAKRLLIGTKSSIINVAISCGFSSSSHFSSAFKRSMGITPKVFRLESQR
ncbi:MAG: AraC family transcriptional regulator [Exilibacterium sp.]